MLIERVEIGADDVAILWRDDGFVDVLAEFSDHPFVHEQREMATA